MLQVKPFVPLTSYRAYPEAEMLKRSQEFYSELDRRRTVREFSSKPVPRAVIENCILTANTAPSGAHMQPWHFVAISNPEIKQKIRLAAEEEEREFYSHRAGDEWLRALEPLGTDDQKPFLEIAPYLIVVFTQVMHYEGEEKVKHYYPYESTGLATGMLISAVHHAGLASLTHTPNPMKFLNEILERPSYERPFLILVVGYPEDGVKVPDLERKPLNACASFFD